MYPPYKINVFDAAGKPGSVFAIIYLWPTVANRLKPSPKTRGPRYAFHDVASGGVYKADTSPYRR